MLGGAIWCTGAVANFVASGAHLRGPGRLLLHRPGRNHGLRLLGRLCLARVCRRAPLARMLLLFMFIFFALGLVAVALAPLY